MTTTTVQVPQKATRIVTKRSWNLRSIFGYVLLYVFLIMLSVAFFFPFWQMLIGSLMPKEELFKSYPQLWPPGGPTLHAYLVMMHLEDFGRLTFMRDFFILRYIGNSFVIATVAVSLQVFFNTMAGYIYAKRNFPFKNQLFTVIVATLLLPTAINFVPYFILIGRLGWMNTYLPFWIPGASSAFGIFLMRQFIVATIPDELIDSATIDGANQFVVLTRLVMPIMSGGMVVLGILAFVGIYNDFVMPSLLLTNPDIRPVQVALATFQRSNIRAPNYDLLFAGSMLATIPLLIFFFIFQKQIMQGVMSGAIKG
jgi:ABC-type glycerol-3-phosphate transport system permease component